MAEMPELVKLQESQGPDGVRVQLLSLDLVTQGGKDSVEGVQGVLERIGAPLETLVFEGDIGGLLSHYELSNSLPQALVLDRDGSVRGRGKGRKSAAQLQDLVDRSL